MLLSQVASPSTSPCANVGHAEVTTYAGKKIDLDYFFEE